MRSSKFVEVSAVPVARDHDLGLNGAPAESGVTVAISWASGHGMFCCDCQGLLLTVAEYWWLELIPLITEAIKWSDVNLRSHSSGA